jgi:hypothetical protein
MSNVKAQIPNECQMTTRQTDGGQDAKTLNKLSPQWNKKDKGIPRGRRNHPPSLAHRRWAGYGGQAKIRKHEIGKVFGRRLIGFTG